MLWSALIFCFLFLCVIPTVCYGKRKHSGHAEDFGSHLVASMKDDANLDLPMDEEYEDLRAELLAYHSALASLASGVSGDSGRRSLGNNRKSYNHRRSEEPRRSMKVTECWKMGGVCINYKLCRGDTYLTEVPGCKNKLDVCCFSWNKYQVRFNDFHRLEIANPMYPWKNYRKPAYGGKGLVPMSKESFDSHKKKKEHKTAAEFFRDGNFNKKDDYVEYNPPSAIAVVLRHILER